MLDGLLDGYTRSILIFTGIHIIAAYSFYVPGSDVAVVLQPKTFLFQGHGVRQS